jgi:hypothetical protein
MKAECRKPAHADAVCDLAVFAVMNQGTFETSGAAKLAVLRRSGLMIAYHTPFNPLPPMSEELKYLAAMDGRTAHLQPYGIDIWYEGLGKVFRAGWRPGEAVSVDFYRSGEWENLFDAIVNPPLDANDSESVCETARPRRRAAAPRKAGTRKKATKRNTFGTH